MILYKKATPIIQMLRDFGTVIHRDGNTYYHLPQIFVDTEMSEHIVEVGSDEEAFDRIEKIIEKL